MWGYEHSGIEPDIMTLGKRLGGGVPLAALVATDAVSCFEHGDQGGTFNGNPLMAAVGCAVMDAVSRPASWKRQLFAAPTSSKGLAGLSARHGLGEVRGRGLLLALDLKQDMASKVSTWPVTQACCSTRRRPIPCGSCPR